MRKILLILAVIGLTGCSDVPPGYVGVKVFLTGGDKGVDSQLLGVGRYWIGINESLFLFPTFTQNHVWTKAKTEGSPNDDSFTFQTRQGLSVNTDVGISYHIDGGKVTNIFQKYRKGTDEITNVVLRNSVRDAFNKAGSTKEIETVYGEGKAALMDEVLSIVQTEMGPVGIEVESLYLVGDMRLPDSVVEAINLKIQAGQRTAQREQEVAQSRAEAQKVIEEARGVAESTMLKAQADAEAISIKGKALANNPNVIEYEKVSRWDGALPQVVGTNTPFINLGK